MTRLSLFVLSAALMFGGTSAFAGETSGCCVAATSPKLIQVADVQGSSGSTNSSQQSGDNKAKPQKTYTLHETLGAAETFFGGTTEGLAKAIEKVFADNGRPDAYVTGNEGSGAFVVGLRYGAGTLRYKGGGAMPVYWRGPSVGWDFGGNASKVFMLVYDLRWTNQLFRRYPGVDGSFYLVAGVGVNYVRRDGVTIAPIRTGVGLRAGASVGYLDFSRKRDWSPF